MNKRTYLFILACLLLLANCREREETKPAVGSISTTEPDAVSGALKIEGASSIQGTPPAPSTDAAAPRINEITQGSIRTASGFTTLLGVQVEAGGVAGFYLQVNGANNYYRVTTNRAGGRLGKRLPLRSAGRSARITQEDSVAYLPIQIPENIQPGKFCITYCVFDQAGRVSNPVTQCIEVMQLGASGETKIAQHWSLRKYREDTLVQLVGQESCFDDQLFGCSDSSRVVTYQFCYRDDKFEMNLAANGGLRIISASTIRQPTEDSYSRCDSIEYITESYEDVLSGGWSYDASTKKLIIVFNYVDDYNGETETVPVELTVTALSDSELIAKEEEAEYYFVKK